MTKACTLSAFGALNQDSYDMFSEHLLRLAGAAGIGVALTCASPYPNASAVSEPLRPLRAEALESAEKKNLLFAAVADDARKAGALTADIRCMPCMSMIGFHDGVEQALGKPIFRLADALATRYKNIDNVGVIHMRPAKKRIEEIFGAKAVTPDESATAALADAEVRARQDGHNRAVEDVMRQITQTWRDQGLKHVLFARADAPKAEKGPAGHVDGIEIDSYFRILADAIIRTIPSP